MLRLVRPLIVTLVVGTVAVVLPPAQAQNSEAGLGGQQQGTFPLDPTSPLPPAGTGQGELPAPPAKTPSDIQRGIDKEEFDNPAEWTCDDLRSELADWQSERSDALADLNNPSLPPADREEARQDLLEAEMFIAAIQRALAKRCMSTIIIPPDAGKEAPIVVTRRKLYVALGDSVAAGHGLRRFSLNDRILTASGRCSRTGLAYPDKVQFLRGYSKYVNLACWGWTSDEVLNGKTPLDNVRKFAGNVLVGRRLLGVGELIATNLGPSQVAGANNLIKRDPADITLTVGANDYDLTGLVDGEFFRRTPGDLAFAERHVKDNVGKVLDGLGQPDVVTPDKSNRRIFVTEYPNIFNSTKSVWVDRAQKKNDLCVGMKPKPTAPSTATRPVPGPTPVQPIQPGAEKTARECQQMLNDTVKGLNKALDGAVDGYSKRRGANWATAKLVRAPNFNVRCRRGVKRVGTADIQEPRPSTSIASISAFGLRNGNDCLHPSISGQDKIATQLVKQMN